MAENSKISWTEHTFNPWIGCSWAGPGCDHCYAEKLATTRLGVGWGDYAPRRRTAPANWNKVRRWNEHAPAFIAEHGRKPRVFAPSLGDPFDNKVPTEWRDHYWALVKATPNLQWLIVTKRSGNVPKMLPADWGPSYAHVVLIYTVCNRLEAARDVPRLLSFKEASPWIHVGLSIEPMLEPFLLDIAWIRPQRGCGGAHYGTGAPNCPRTRHHHHDEFCGPRLDGVIVGGESKQLPGSRPLVKLRPAWVRALRDQCGEARLSFHFKQWGEFISASQFRPELGFVTAELYEKAEWVEDEYYYPLGAQRTGRMLDGNIYDGMFGQ